MEKETDSGTVPVRLSEGTITLLSTDFQKLREYMVALERARADLMGVNEELRTKIAALERGQIDLADRLLALRDVAKNRPGCARCQSGRKYYDAQDRIERCSNCDSPLPPVSIL